MDKINKLIGFPLDMLKKVERYKEENYIPSFTAAVFELIRKGLEK